MIEKLSCKGVLFSKENLLFNMRHHWRTVDDFYNFDVLEKAHLTTLLSYGFYRGEAEYDFIYRFIMNVTLTLAEPADLDVIRRELYEIIAECVEEWEVEENDEHP